MAFRDDKVVRRADNYVETELDGEVILLNVESGDIFSLSRTGRTVWSHIESPIVFGELITAICGRFKVDRETCASDVARFLVRMKEYGLINLA